MQRLREPRNAAIVGILLAALIVVIFLVARGGNDNSNSQPKPTGGAQQASQRQLEDLASSVNHPVYWAGARPGKRYELTVTDNGNIFVRYLDPGTPVGSRQVASLSVGTYPLSDAYAATKKAASQPGTKTGQTPDGGFVFTSDSDPSSVYLAYPDTDVQVEVFDPDPTTAFSLATSGEIVPIP